MDKASDKQMIDIHTGIRNTLTMLNFKLKKANVTVVENYDDYDSKSESISRRVEPGLDKPYRQRN